MTFTPMPHLGLGDEIDSLLKRAPRHYAKGHSKNVYENGREIHGVSITAFDEDSDPEDEGTVVLQVSGPRSVVTAALLAWLESEGL